MNGASLLAKTLSRAGVKTVFSLSGNQIMPVYDAAIDADLRIIHTRHEGGAVYMADGFAQITGGLGVALVTAAPGFANAISALYSARMNESPVLFLSGDSPVAEDGNAPFQELDQCAMTRPVVKFSGRPETPEELGRMLTHAMNVALSGRPGPIHIALPFDVLNANVDGGTLLTVEESTPEPFTGGPQIAEALAQSQRPIILVGPQLNEGRGQGRAAALRKSCCAPVVCLESPRGLRDPALGAFAEVLRKADLVIGIGKVPDFTMGFARPPAVSADAKLIFLDPEEAAITRARTLSGDRAQLIARADTLSAADAIIAAAKPTERADWLVEVDAAAGYRTDPSTAPGVHPRALCASVQKILDAADDPILVCDGGEFGQWCQALLNAPMRLTNGLSGAIGGCLGYAMAAKVARPEATVILLMGDGTAGFYLAEFETAAREGIDILAIIGNDDVWNAEHQIQIRDYGPDRTMGCTLSPGLRYDHTAETLGCYGAHIGEESEIQSVLHAALAADKPACINVAIASLAAPKFQRG